MDTIHDISDIHAYLKSNVSDIDIPSDIELKCEHIYQYLVQYKFALFSGHDISNDIILETFHIAGKYFNMSIDDKSTCISKDRARRGYSGCITENFASLVGDTHKPNDMVEKYRIGPMLDDNRDYKCEYYMSKEGRIHFYPNTWPSTSMIPDFQLVMTSYYQAMNTFSLIILRILEIGMHLSEGILTRGMDKHTSILSMNYYDHVHHDHDDIMASRRLDDDHIIRVANHKDVSMLTIVSQMSHDINSADSQTSSQGLELLIDNPSSMNSSWESISTSYSTFIVHIGDCLEDWSRGVLQSVNHRVVSSTSNPMQRYSLAYFVSPNHDARMGNLQPEAEDTMDMDNVITYSQWRKQHIKKARSIQRQNIAASTLT